MSLVIFNKYLLLISFSITIQLLISFKGISITSFLENMEKYYGNLSNVSGIILGTIRIFSMLDGYT